MISMPGKLCQQNNPRSPGSNSLKSAPKFEFNLGLDYPTLSLDTKSATSTTSKETKTKKRRCTPSVTLKTNKSMPSWTLELDPVSSQKSSSSSWDGVSMLLLTSSFC